MKRSLPETAAFSLVENHRHGRRVRTVLRDCSAWTCPSGVEELNGRVFNTDYCCWEDSSGRHNDLRASVDARTKQQWCSQQQTLKEPFGLPTIPAKRPDMCHKRRAQTWRFESGKPADANVSGVFPAYHLRFRPQMGINQQNLPGGQMALQVSHPAELLQGSSQAFYSRPSNEKRYPAGAVHSMLQKALCLKMLV